MNIQEDNRLVIWLLIVTMLGAMLVFLFALMAQGKDVDYPRARCAWTPPPDPLHEVIGYGVIIQKTLSGSPPVQMITPIPTIWIDLAWQEPVRVSVVPITLGFKTWFDWQSDWSETVCWNQVGLQIEQQGDTIWLKTAPVPSELQSSADLKSWQPEGVIVDSKAISGAGNKKFWRIKR